MATLDFAYRVEENLRLIDESDEIHPANKEAIERFKRDLAIEDVSDAWLQKLTSHLKVVAEEVGPDRRFDELDEEDIRNLVEWIQNRDVTDSTVNSYKQVLKRFYRWLYENPKGEHPEPVDWINTTRRQGNDTLPKDLLTQDEVRDIIEAAGSARDKAFIAVLWETGARIGELIDLEVGDIEDNDHGKKVVVDGKTGERRLPLIESSPYLNRWLNQHPTKGDDDPLWCSSRAPYQQLTYQAIRKFLDRSAGAADVDKPTNPHHFRHSRATYLAARDEFNEFKLCQWFGWVQGSDVPARYLHLSGADIDEAYGRMHGLEPEDGQEDEETVFPCPRCEELNAPEDRYCSRCGQALNVSAAEEIEVAEEKTTSSAESEDMEMALQLTQKMMENPNLVEEFLEQTK